MLNSIQNNTPMVNYAFFLDQQHWMDDAFLGYKYWNSVNPVLIQCCTALPGNFPVTDDMVFLHGGRCLIEEMRVCFFIFKN